MDKYQVMPSLSEAEYQELKKDIAERGLMVPIEYDDEGNILDGHHRVKICQELGITAWPRLIRKNLNEKQKGTHARMLNLARRHLTQDQRRELIREQLKETPEQSDRQIARSLGVSPTTVGTERINAEKAGDVSKLDTRIDTKGRKQPATKPQNTVFLSEKMVEDTTGLTDDLKDSVLKGELKGSQAIRQMKKDELKEKASALPEGKYRVIYADPPWKYNDKCDSGGVQAAGAEKHYPAMSLAELEAMAIPDMAADDSVLFLWATCPLLEDALKLAKAWGFKYKAQFVWDKVKHNMGHYNSVRHELLLICTKGSCTPDNVKLFDSVQSIEKTEHSRKPEDFRTIIDTLYTVGKKIELFRRGETPEGWEAWGNELI